MEVQGLGANLASKISTQRAIAEIKAKEVVEITYGSLENDFRFLQKQFEIYGL